MPRKANTEECQTITLSIKKNLAEDLRTYAGITGKTISGIVTEVLEQRLVPLRNAEHQQIRTEEGVYRKSPEEAPQLCYILNKTTVYGQPYYVIYFDGGIRSVPRDQVEVIGSESTLPPPEL